VQCRRVQSADALAGCSSSIGRKPSTVITSARLIASSLSLSPEENRIIKSVRAEFERRGGFVRIFPSAESWKRYGCFLGKHSKGFQ
jgi:tubulin polyglutamylase TTLL5